MVRPAWACDLQDLRGVLPDLVGLPTLLCLSSQAWARGNRSVPPEGGTKPKSGHHGPGLREVTRREVPVGARFQLRHVGGADIPRLPAPRAEPAARRRVERARHVAL